MEGYVGNIADTRSITRTIDKGSIKILNHLKEDEVNRSDGLEIPVLI